MENYVRCLGAYKNKRMKKDTYRNLQHLKSSEQNNNYSTRQNERWNMFVIKVFLERGGRERKREKGQGSEHFLWDIRKVLLLMLSSGQACKGRHSNSHFINEKL